MSPGRFAMTFAGWTTGIGEWVDFGYGIAWGGGDGLLMTINAITFNSYFGWVDALGVPLDTYVDGAIEDNGGTWSLYGAGNFFAHAGAHLFHAAGILAGAAAIAPTLTNGTVLLVKPTGGWLVRVFKLRGNPGRWSYEIFNWQKRLRIEAHPIRASWPSWAYYPHWHADFLGPVAGHWHLPIVEPIGGGGILWWLWTQGDD